MARKNLEAVESVNPCYNPFRDIKAVEQLGSVDLVTANAMNSLPANLTAETLSYNEIDDPNSIGYRPRDVFEGAQSAKVITDYVPPKAEE